MDFSVVDVSLVSINELCTLTGGCPGHGVDVAAANAEGVSLCHTDSVEDDFELSTVCHRPESMDKLQEQTKFTKRELQVLYRGFKNVGVAAARPGVAAALYRLWMEALSL